MQNYYDQYFHLGLWTSPLATVRESAKNCSSLAKNADTGQTAWAVRYESALFALIFKLAASI